MQVHLDLYSYIENVGANWREIGNAINVKGSQIKYSMSHETLGIKTLRKIADLVDFDMSPYEDELEAKERNLKVLRELDMRKKNEKRKAEAMAKATEATADEEPALNPEPMADVANEPLTSNIGEMLKAKKTPVADVAMVAHMAKAVTDKAKIETVVDAAITLGEEINKAKPIPVPEELPAMADELVNYDVDVDDPGEPNEELPFSDCNEMYKEASKEEVKPMDIFDYLEELDLEALKAENKETAELIEQLQKNMAKNEKLIKLGELWKNL